MGWQNNWHESDLHQALWVIGTNWFPVGVGNKVSIQFIKYTWWNMCYIVDYLVNLLFLIKIGYVAIQYPCK